MSTSELRKIYGEPVRRDVLDGGQYGRDVVTEFYRCGCSADDVRGVDQWAVTYAPACKIQTHYM